MKQSVRLDPQHPRSEVEFRVGANPTHHHQDKRLLDPVVLMILVQIPGRKPNAV